MVHVWLGQVKYQFTRPEGQGEVNLKLYTKHSIELPVPPLLQVDAGEEDCEGCHRCFPHRCSKLLFESTAEKHKKR